MNDLVAAARAWQADDPDPATRAEVDALIVAGDEAGLRERFTHRLQFGTAGLRGPLGAGPARMNRAMVRRATAGLADWLRTGGHGGGRVVVGRDARHGSDVFAADTAAVLAAAGFDVVALADPLPTPVTAFAVRHLGAVAGVAITASHNPPGDNGYKLFLADGAQIVPPVDAEVSVAIDRVGPVADIPVTPVPAVASDQVVAEYVRTVVGQLRQGGPRRLRAVHTALHGVGTATVRAAFAAAGFEPLVEVGAQADPDPDFPTVAFPNPEEPGALDLALAAAEECDADLVLANDPDADRLAVAVPGRDGGWRVLTGDELGVVLADHVLRTRPPQPNDVVATTLVSSRQLFRLGEELGIRVAETLTGFKWVVRAPAPGERFRFGYEEALGYCVGDAVRDKDGVSAALVAAELVAGLLAEGRTLLDRLDELARRHGLHVTRTRSYRIEGVDWRERVRATTDSARARPPTELAGRAVTAVEDLRDGERFPPADVLVWSLDGGRVVVRPSGTEPKVKVYAEVVLPVADGDDVDAVRHHAEAAVEALHADAARRLGL